MMRWLLFALALTTSAASADPTRVIASATGEKNGGGVSVLVAMPNGVTFGLSGYQLHDTRWFYATGELTRRVSARDIVDVQADVGSVNHSPDRAYRIFRAAISHEVVKRLSAELESRYIDVSGQRGNLLKGGLRVARNETAVSASYYVSTSGNLDSQFVSARIDRAISRYALLAGGAVGHAAPVIFAGPGGGQQKTHVRELFGGVTIGPVQFVVDLLKAGGVSRTRGIVTWSFTR